MPAECLVWQILQDPSVLLCCAGHCPRDVSSPQLHRYLVSHSAWCWDRHGPRAGGSGSARCRTPLNSAVSRRHSQARDGDLVAE